MIDFTLIRRKKLTENVLKNAVIYLHIKRVQVEKDLGITVISDRKPSVQCSKAVAKAMQVLGVIKRNCVLNDIEDFRLLFIGFVRPHLEYCVHVWYAYLRKDIDSIELVS